MKYAFYFGHPAQYLFAREAISKLQEQDHEVLILIKKKDVLETLVQADGQEYINVLPEQRGNSKLSIVKSLFKRLRAIRPILKKFQPDLLISSDASMAQLGRLMKIPCITILEDDYAIIKPLAKLTYPFTSTILCPNVCDVGKWEKKKVGYDGYMKLAYLHPNYFQSNIEIVKGYNIPDQYALVRLSQLSAYHDEGIKGISQYFLDKVIKILEKRGIKVLISSESSLDPKYDQHKLNIEAKDMHHLLANASILISDSQSMSVEAAMLGVPSLRCSSFSGKISVLEELEQVYHLTFGFQTDETDPLILKLKNILSDDNFRNKFQQRRTKMLSDKIDVTNFLVWFLNNYPKSSKRVTYNVKTELNVHPTV